MFPIAQEAEAQAPSKGYLLTEVQYISLKCLHYPQILIYTDIALRSSLENSLEHCANSIIEIRSLSLSLSL